MDMKKKVLVVDDEKDIVDLITHNLEKEGFVTIRAYDGEAALDLIKSKKPDLVILDLMLPVSGGWMCAGSYGKNRRRKPCPLSC